MSSDAQSPIRVAIADGHGMFRQGLRCVLERRGGFEVVGEASSAADIQAMVVATTADVLLLEPGMDRATLADIRSLAERLPVIVLTASDDLDDGVAAVRQGARAVVLKRSAVETLVDAIRAVVAGREWLPAEMQPLLAVAAPEPAPALTPRERDIVRHVARGLRNAEVATALSISEETVKTHLNNIFRKLGLRDRVELALRAVRLGLVGRDGR